MQCICSVIVATNLSKLSQVSPRRGLHVIPWSVSDLSLLVSKIISVSIFFAVWSLTQLPSLFRIYITFRLPVRLSVVIPGINCFLGFVCPRVALNITSSYNDWVLIEFTSFPSSGIWLRNQILKEYTDYFWNLSLSLLSFWWL